MHLSACSQTRTLIPLGIKPAASAAGLACFQNAASHIHQALEDLVSQSCGLASLVSQLTGHHNTAGSWAYMMWHVQNDTSACIACNFGNAKVAQQTLQPS